MSRATWDFIGAIIATIVAHFLYQALFFGEPNWGNAIERSWFGTCAILVAWFNVRNELSK